MSDGALFGLIFGLVLVVSIIVFICIYVPISVYIENRKTWVFNHSNAIKYLTIINRKYETFSVPTIEFIHDYDNAKIYDDISPKDYLVYELVNNSKNVYKKVNELRSKLEDYKAYINEINSKCRYNSFTETPPYKNIEKVKLVEKELFKSLVKHQGTGYAAKVTLNLTTIDGDYIKKKSEKITPEKVRRIRVKISKKRDGFYIYNDIWESLCKVERGKVTNKIRFEIYKKDNYKCCRCGSKENLEIDHIIPISRGGKSSISNLQTLCHACNVRKGVQAIRYVKK